MFLDVAFVDFRRTGQTGAQGVAGEEPQTLFFGQLGADAGVQDRALDQPRDVLVVQARVQRAFPVSRGAHEDRTEVDPGKV